MLTMHAQFIVNFFAAHLWLHPHSWHQMRREMIHAYPHLHWLRHYRGWRGLFRLLWPAGSR